MPLDLSSLLVFWHGLNPAQAPSELDPGNWAWVCIPWELRKGQLDPILPPNVSLSDERIGDCCNCTGESRVTHNSTSTWRCRMTFHFQSKLVVILGPAKITLAANCQLNIMHVYKHMLGFTQELLKINGHENCECDCPALFVVDRLKVLFFD